MSNFHGNIFIFRFFSLPQQVYRIAKYHMQIPLQWKGLCTTKIAEGILRISHSSRSDLFFFFFENKSTSQFNQKCSPLLFVATGFLIWFIFVAKWSYSCSSPLSSDISPRIPHWALFTSAIQNTKSFIPIKYLFILFGFIQKLGNPPRKLCAIRNAFRFFPS